MKSSTLVTLILSSVILATNGQFISSRLSLSDTADRLQKYFLFEGVDFKGVYPKIDLVFVVQASNRYAFSNYVAFVKDLLRYFSIEGSLTRVAMVTFGARVKVEFDLNSYSNRECVNKAIDRARYSAGYTNMGNGLQAAYNLINDETRGARKYSRQLVFVLSAGTMYGMDNALSITRQITSQKRRNVYIFGTGYRNSFQIFQRLSADWQKRSLFIIRSMMYLGAVIRRANKIGKRDTCCSSRSIDIYDECNRRCTCVRGRMVNCCRVRKEFTSMTVEERARYLQTYKTLTTVEPYKTKYNKFIAIHVNNFDTNIHDKSEFLPWHRWYILELENLLREIDCRVTVPYWAWSLWSHDPWSAASIWGLGPEGFGGNGVSGECVNSGQFAQGSWFLPDGTSCLERDFFGVTPDQVAVSSALGLQDFSDFELTLRAVLHDNVHCLIGGTMCTIDSASAPEFFLHHCYVDKLWNDWQQNSTANKNVYFPSISGWMVNTTYERKDLIDIMKQPGCVRVCYDDPVSNNAREVTGILRATPLRRLVTIPRRPITSVSTRARALFKLSSQEILRSAKLETIIRGQMTKTRRITPLNSVDNILGFSTSSIESGTTKLAQGTTSENSVNLATRNLHSSSLSTSSESIDAKWNEFLKLNS